MPPAAQPWPGRIMAYNASGNWTNAVPNVHRGIHNLYENAAGLGVGKANQDVRLPSCHFTKSSRQQRDPLVSSVLQQTHFSRIMYGPPACLPCPPCRP